MITLCHRGRRKRRASRYQLQANNQPTQEMLTTRSIVTRETPDPSPSLTERSRFLQTLALLMLTDHSQVKLALTATVGGAQGL